MARTSCAMEEITGTKMSPASSPANEVKEENPNTGSTSGDRRDAEVPKTVSPAPTEESNKKRQSCSNIENEEPRKNTKHAKHNSHAGGKENAGDATIKKDSKGCKCKKLACMRSICGCKKANILCSDKCSCIGCHNSGDKGTGIATGSPQSAKETPVDYDKKETVREERMNPCTSQDIQNENNPNMKEELSDEEEDDDPPVVPDEDIPLPPDEDIPVLPDEDNDNYSNLHHTLDKSETSDSSFTSIEVEYPSFLDDIAIQEKPSEEELSQAEGYNIVVRDRRVDGEPPAYFQNAAGVYSPPPDENFDQERLSSPIDYVPNQVRMTQNAVSSTGDVPAMEFQEAGCSHSYRQPNQSVDFANVRYQGGSPPDHPSSTTEKRPAVVETLDENVPNSIDYASIIKNACEKAVSECKDVITMNVEKAIVDVLIETGRINDCSEVNRAQALPAENHDEVMVIENYPICANEVVEIGEMDIGEMDTSSPQATSTVRASDHQLEEANDEAKSCWEWCRRRRPFSDAALYRNIADMLRSALIHSSDYHDTHVNRQRGLALIFKITRRVHYREMVLKQIVALIWSGLAVVHHFYIRAGVTNITEYRRWCRKRHFRRAFAAYKRILSILLPNLIITVTKTVLTFFTITNVWVLESYVTMCIEQILLICEEGAEELLDHLLDLVHICESPGVAHNMIKILTNVFMIVSWKNLHSYIMHRFLELYRRCIMNEEYEIFKEDIETCIRVGFSQMRRREVIKVISMMLAWVDGFPSNMPEDFCSVLEDAAGTNNAERYKLNLKGNFLFALFDMVASPKQNISLLACRLLAACFDRQKNGRALIKARIYVVDEVYPIRIGSFDRRDWMFIKDIAEDLQASLITAIMKHGTQSRNVQMIFGVLAAIVVETPCSFTCALAVSFAMSVQEYTLIDPAKLKEAAYRIHASIASVLTLVAHVHKAKVLQRYLNRVIESRSGRAPQLNPPVCKQYASYPLQLLRADLYFEDHELRHGLYRCFVTDALLKPDLGRKQKNNLKKRSHPIESLYLREPRKRRSLLQHLQLPGFGVGPVSRYK